MIKKIAKNSAIFFCNAYFKLRSDVMAYKEIVTKAVIGKGKKKYRNSYQVTT